MFSCEYCEILNSTFFEDHQQTAVCAFIYVFIHLLTCLRFPLDEMTGDFAMISRRNYFATKLQAETKFSFHMNTLTRLLKTLSKIRLLLIKIKLRIKINELWVFVFLGPRPRGPPVP